jgi:hypothetical protein
MPYFRYRLYWPQGAEASSGAEYVERVRPDEIVWMRGGLKLRVLSRWSRKVATRIRGCRWSSPA